jgi:myo-inositol-1(or 4)-monophosphatase
MVATGSLDYYFIDNEFLRVTDIAAAILVLKEAGGVATNILGNKIDMPLNLDDRTSIIAACNENVIRQIIS